MAAPKDKTPITVIVITVMVMMSGILRFVQETKSGNVTNKLLQMIHTTASVQRDGIKKEFLSMRLSSVISFGCLQAI